MGFLGDFGEALGTAINDHFSPGENELRSLDTVDPDDPDRTISFGRLGNFANKIDRSAERTYIESGFVNNIRPRPRKVLMQQPDLTVVVKKRMFSSLVENFRVDLLDNDERLFLEASKQLFKNKCRTLAIYERLSKINNVSRETGIVDSSMFSQIIEGIRILENEVEDLGLLQGQPGFLGDIAIPGTTSEASGAAINILSAISPLTREALQKARDIGFLSRPAPFTRFYDSGVFEITTVASLNTTVSTKFKGGSADLTIEDPYNILWIKESDIDKAIADVTNILSKSSFFSVAELEIQRIIADSKYKLNTIRRQRGAQPIIFQINPQTVISRKIRPIIDGVGIELYYEYDPGILGIKTGGVFGVNSPLSDAAGAVGIGSNSLVGKFTRKLDQGPQVTVQNIEGINGLQDRELKLFEKIITNILKLFKIKETTDNRLIEFNETTNFVRNKMRLHYGGKSMFQPMDVVHIFIGSKTTVDAKIADALQMSFAGLNMGQKINNLTRDINSMFGDLKSLFGGQGNSTVNLEKSAIVGPDFPTWLWMKLRNDFTRQEAGTHVFAGLVKGASQNYDAGNGKHILQISCEDFSGYFDKGQFNRKPAVDVFNTSLYDPLTPFNLTFDKATGFVTGETPEYLNENMQLFEAGVLRHKFGRARGEKVTQITQSIGDGERANRQFRRVFNEPDGMVYRWKEGIGSLLYTGQPHSPDSAATERSVALTQNPFAGQDVMNVLSLLITGEPYNFNTFIRAALSSGNLNRDGLINENPAVSFIVSLRNDLSRLNATWGNFMPFKKMDIDEQSWKQIQLGELSAIQANEKINQLLRERARLFDELTLRNSEFALNPQLFSIDENGNVQPIATAFGPNAITTVHTSLTSGLIAQIAEKDIEIERERINLRLLLKEVNKNQGELKIIGNDLSFDPSLSEQNVSVTETERDFDRREFRRKIKFLTLRRLWQVKSNEDKNFFIVDDQYDKNYDIQAYERALAGKLQILQSQFTNTVDDIRRTANILGLEIFANTQGHIEVKPPSYNKMPSSVFYKMFKDANKLGKRVFPDFLESLFVNQTQDLISRIEIAEDEIRLRTAILGKSTDGSSESFLRGTESSFGSSSFNFVTEERSGKLGGKDIRTLVNQAYNTNNESKPLRALGDIENNLQQALGRTRNFDILRRIETVNETRFINAFTQDIVDRIDRIRQRLEVKTGQPAKTVRELLSNDRADINARSQVDILKINNELSRLVSDRQILIKQLSNSIRSLREGVSLNVEGRGANSALFQFLNRQDQIPKVLEHMIEDESNHDLGPGSGGRFVIEEHQIISFRLTENPPDYTIIAVNGALGEADARGLTQPPGQLAVDGGNLFTGAFAVDYDMWRMYGFKQTNTVQAPFFSDPKTQCAPYAVYLLNLARQNILRATCSIAGNEYMQPGEVVYIRHKDMLFYVESVNHSYDYNGNFGNFTTNLELTYGHSPGIYIPTMLDVVGGALYKNRIFAEQYRSVRHGHCTDERPINAVVFEQDQNLFFNTNPLETLVTGPSGDENRKALTNSIVMASGVLDPTNRQKIPMIEIRMYHNSLKGVGAHVGDQLFQAAQAIKDWFSNPQRTSLLNNKKVDPSDTDSNFFINKENITIRGDIDLGGETKVSPSAKAWLLARNLSGSAVVPTPEETDISAVEQALYKSVIDIWVTFETPIDSLSTGSSYINRFTDRSRTVSEFEVNARNQLEALLGKLNTGTSEDVS